MTFLRNWFKREPTARERWLEECERERIENLRKRILRIKRIAGHYHDQAPKGRDPADTVVLIPAEELLRIWDISDKLYWDV